MDRVSQLGILTQILAPSGERVAIEDKSPPVEIHEDLFAEDRAAEQSKMHSDLLVTVAVVIADFMRCRHCDDALRSQGLSAKPSHPGISARSACWYCAVQYLPTDARMSAGLDTREPVVAGVPNALDLRDELTDAAIEAFAVSSVFDAVTIGLDTTAVLAAGVARNAPEETLG